MRLKNQQEGYTLIELIVATTIIAILLVGIMTFLTTTMINNSVRNARADLLREAQLTLDVVTRDIRLSANVDAANRLEDPNSPDEGDIEGFGWNSDNDTLVLATAVEDNDRNIVFQDQAHYITEKNNIVYYIQNGNLYKRTIAADIEGNRLSTTCPEDLADNDCRPDIRLAENVQNFTVRYFDALNQEVNPDQARSVEITLILHKRRYGRDVTAEYSTRTVFRNE